MKTYVVVGHKAEAVKAAVAGRAEIVVQERLLGTADAVRTCQAYFKGARGTVLVMCGDTPLLDKSVVRMLVKAHARSGAACTVLAANLDEPSGYGRIIRDHSGEFVAIREDKDASVEEKKVPEINTGVYCFNAKRLFDSINRIPVNTKKKEFYLTDIIELFCKKGLKVRAVTTNDWTATLGINTRKDLALAEALKREKILLQLMSSGVTIMDPATTYIEDGVSIGRDTVIYPCTYIHGGVRIGKHCSVGPFARLRPGTRLADHVSIGNFAEVSRSKLGEGVTMKHFSFLGDSEVGRKANIGCGAVTANYDGKNKNKTLIGPGAFIGCDAVMVAPVKVGQGAVVGAGSVVTAGKNVPAYSVAIGIPARVIKKVKKP